LFDKKISLSIKKKPGLDPVPDLIRVHQQYGSGFSNTLDLDPTPEKAKCLDPDPKP
jgi:hypothetical protein